MRNIWAVVVLVGLALASITTLSLFHVDDPGVYEFIGACVVPTVATLLIGQTVAGKVDQVHEQVNGRMSQLLGKVPDPPAQPPAAPPAGDAGGTSGGQ